MFGRFGLGVKPDGYSCTVTHRGTLCWWEDLLEKRATKEKQSVHTWMGHNVYHFSSVLTLFIWCCLLKISPLFRF